LFYEAPHRNRIVDAFGVNVTKDIPNWVYNGQITSGADSMVTHGWTVTDTDAGAGDLLITPQSDGTTLVTTAANAYDGVSMQRIIGNFKLLANSPLYCGCRVKLSNATASTFLFGLCSVSDATLTAADTAHATGVAYGCYFSKLAAVTAGYFNTEENTTETNVAAWTASTSWTWLEFFAEDATTVKAYVNGVYVGQSTTNLPTSALGLSFSYRAGASGAVTCYIDRMYAVQLCPKA